MRFKLTLEPSQIGQQIPLNYQYELSSSIYRIIEKADATYSDFLHDNGYKVGRKTFKFFSFSNLIIPAFDIRGDRLKIRSQAITLFVSFYMDKAAESFIIGLFQDQRFSIGDKISRADFSVQSIEALPTEGFNKDEAIFRTLSPIVVGEKNQKGNDNYLAPTDEKFGKYLLENLIDKYRATEQSIPISWQSSEIKFELIDAQKLKSRLITLKAHTPEETKVRGYTDFTFKLTAPKELLALALYAGVGKQNSQGFGCVEVLQHNR